MNINAFVQTEKGLLFPRIGSFDLLYRIFFFLTDILEIYVKHKTQSSFHKLTAIMV